MAFPPPRTITSGYYRIQLWVLLGLNTVASLAVFTAATPISPFPGGDGWLLGLSVLLSIACYVGSVVWLYERHQAGRVALLVVSLMGLVAAILATRWPDPLWGIRGALAGLDLLTSGLLLGVTLAAMLLGHWYLNSPTMQLLPLQRLVLLMLASVVLRGLVCGGGLLAQWSEGFPSSTSLVIFLACRWIAGLLGVGLMAVLTWYTLKVPNTQSATGILYAAVILAFIGELLAQLLSDTLTFPV